MDEKKKQNKKALFRMGNRKFTLCLVRYEEIIETNIINAINYAFTSNFKPYPPISQNQKKEIKCNVKSQI